MTETAREQLLGYLLGALEEDEQAEIERILDEDAGLQRDLAVLNRALYPLDASRRDFSPPPGLAVRTCEFVSQKIAAGVEQVETAVEKAAAPLEKCVRAAAATQAARRGTKMHALDAATCPNSKVRWQDSLMGVGIMVAACGLLFPAIMDSREQARMMHCQNNLREIGASLAGYSESHNGYFPQVPARGNLAAAGIYAPTLARDGYLSNPRQVICPGSTLAGEREFSIPSLDELQSTADPVALADMQNRMGGSYGYSLGHLENGEYRPTKNLNRENFAVMADSPSHALPSHQSRNHGGKGQNVLFEDGHVKFLPTPRPLDLGDDVFTNEEGRVAAGVHANDSVIGGSNASPFIPGDAQ